MVKSPVMRVLRYRALRAKDSWRAWWLVSVAVAAVFGLISTVSISAAGSGRDSRAQGDEVRALAGGEVMTRRMEAGATHAYELTLGAGQFAQVVVEQRGVDVGVRALMPGGVLLLDVDSPNGFYGRETVPLLAQVAGAYRIEIYSDKAYPPGDYELRVEGPRAASPSDETRMTAQRDFTEAQKLRSEAGSLQGQQAIEKYEAAIRRYGEALGLWRELGELREQGYSLSGMGRSYKAMGQFTPALDYLNQALSRLVEAGDVSGQAFVLNEMGAAHRDLGDLRDAIASYERALELRLGIGDRWGQAQVYNNLGLTYSLMGYQPRAGDNYEKALPIWRALGTRNEEMRTLVNAAKAHAETGDLNIALAQYQEVLNFCGAEIAKESSPLKPFAIFLKPFALNGLGLVYDTWTDTNAALDNYRQALELFRANKYSRGEADVLDNLGLAHAFLGDARQALDYFNQALVIRERLNEPRGLAMTLSNLGYAQTLLDNNQEALKQLGRAHTFSALSRDKRFEAYTLVREGMAYVALHDSSKALEKYKQALAIQQAPESEDRRGQAITLDKMGEALALTGQATEALKSYDRALELWKAVGDSQGQALSLYGIARVESDRHNLANARDRVEEAIDIIESLRSKVTGPQLRMIYFETRQDFYALDIDVRMRLYELTNSASDMEAALWASERGRGRRLNDLLSESRAEIHKDMSPHDAEDYRRLEREISVLTQTVVRMRSVGQKVDAAIVEQKLDARIREQDELLAVAKRNGTLPQGSQPARPLVPREIQQLLDDNTVLLQYSLGEARSHLWVVARTRILHYFLDNRAEIEKAAEQFRQALTAYEPLRPGESDAQYLMRWRRADDQYHHSGLELTRLLLKPILAELGNKRLAIIADGALHYIPFEALPLPGAAISEQSATAVTVTGYMIININET